VATCQFEYKSDYPQVDFSCKEEARIGSTLCIFHDQNYVKDRYVEYELKATKRFEEKVRERSSKNKPLKCIGYFLPAIEFNKYFSISFVRPVNFMKATFYGADFTGATFNNRP
jgi:hypothetical protein